MKTDGVSGGPITQALIRLLKRFWMAPALPQRQLDERFQEICSESAPFTR
jgi:hypothetical protein